MASKRIVVIAEDDDDLRELLVEGLSAEGRRVIELEDGGELLDYLEFIGGLGLGPQLPDLIVTDIYMPGANGLDLVRWAREKGVRCPFVILSGFADEHASEVAAAVGRTTVLAKPQSMAAIQAAAAAALLNGTP